MYVHTYAWSWVQLTLRGCILFCCERCLCFCWHCVLVSGLLMWSLSASKHSKVCRLSLHSIKRCQRSHWPDWQRMEQPEALACHCGPGVRKLPCIQKFLGYVAVLPASGISHPCCTGRRFEMGTKCPVCTVLLHVKCCNALWVRRRMVGLSILMRQSAVAALLLLVTPEWEGLGLAWQPAGGHRRCSPLQGIAECPYRLALVVVCFHSYQHPWCLAHQCPSGNAFSFIHCLSDRGEKGITLLLGFCGKSEHDITE